MKTVKPWRTHIPRVLFVLHKVQNTNVVQLGMCVSEHVNERNVFSQRTLTPGDLCV